MFDCKRITPFCLKKRQRAKWLYFLQIWGAWPLWTPPGYVYGPTHDLINLKCEAINTSTWARLYTKTGEQANNEIAAENARNAELRDHSSAPETLEARSTKAERRDLIGFEIHSFFCAREPGTCLFRTENFESRKKWSLSRDRARCESRESPSQTALHETMRLLRRQKRAQISNKSSSPARWPSGNRRHQRQYSTPNILILQMQTMVLVRSFSHMHVTLSWDALGLL